MKQGWTPSHCTLSLFAEPLITFFLSSSLSLFSFWIFFPVFLVTLILLKTNSTSITRSKNFHYILPLIVTKTWPFPKDISSLAALLRGGSSPTPAWVPFSSQEGCTWGQQSPSCHRLAGSFTLTFLPSFSSLHQTEGLIAPYFFPCRHWPWPMPAEDSLYLPLHISSHQGPETNRSHPCIRHANLPLTLS